jgi:hypothetical protein
MGEKIKIDDASWVDGFSVSYYDGGSGNVDYDPLYWPKPIIKDGVVQFLQFAVGYTYVLASSIIGVRIRHEYGRRGKSPSSTVIMEALLSSGQELACGIEGECHEELVNCLLLASIDNDIPEEDREGWGSYSLENVRSRANRAHHAVHDQVFIPYAAAVLKAAQEARR